MLRRRSCKLRRAGVMGVKEYQQTGGGNNRLMNNYKKEKEANSLSTSAMVNFVAHPLQSFGFDKYTEQKQAIQHYYPALHNGYRPAFKSVGSFRTDRVGVDITEGLHFRDEMGIPSVLVDGGMSVHGAYHGSERALYAYRPTADGEEEIVGKLNVVSFDEEPRRVHIISVNNARLPSVSELEARLNSIYRQAVCTWTVIAQDPVTLTFPGGKMTHGGSGTASTYNSDQRAIAKAFESSGRQMEPGSLYLFFVEDVTFKDRSLAGYMPLQRQVGFIYGNPTLEVVAHELAHGAFIMRHTFSPKAFIIGEGQTQNLMDYAGGTELWKHQWDLIHNPEKILFSWAQDEEEGAMFNQNMTKESIKLVLESIRIANSDKKEFLDLSSFRFSKGTTINLKLDDFTLDYISVDISMGKSANNEANLFQFDPLMIKPSEINREDMDTPEGYSGDFVRYVFQRYNKNTTSPVNAEYLISEEAAIEIVIRLEDVEEFEDFIFGEDRKIVIRINRFRNNSDRTIGLLNIDNGAVTGYTLELPRGTDFECQSTCTDVLKAESLCKRILRGTYRFEITTWSNNTNYINKSLRISDVPGRTGILIHRGVNARIWSYGCILAMRNDPTNDNDNITAAQRANTITDSENFCIEIVNYVNRRKDEIRNAYGIQDVEMILIITEENELND